MKCVRRQEPGNGKMDKQCGRERAGSYLITAQRRKRRQEPGRRKSIKGKKGCEYRLNSETRLIF